MLLPGVISPFGIYLCRIYAAAAVPDETLEAARIDGASEFRAQVRRGPTIDDVAESAGVSRGTVSRVLNGGHYASAAATAVVQRAVVETGYVVNTSARSLVTRRADCIAFVL